MGIFGAGMPAEQTGGARSKVYGQGVAGKKGRVNQEKDWLTGVVGLGKWAFGKSVQGKRVG